MPPTTVRQYQVSIDISTTTMEQMKNLGKYEGSSVFTSYLEDCLTYHSRKMGIRGVATGVRWTREENPATLMTTFRAEVSYIPGPYPIILGAESKSMSDLQRELRYFMLDRGDPNGIILYDE